METKQKQYEVTQECNGKYKAWTLSDDGKTYRRISMEEHKTKRAAKQEIREYKESQ